MKDLQSCLETSPFFEITELLLLKPKDRYVDNSAPPCQMYLRKGSIFQWSEFSFTPWVIIHPCVVVGSYLWQKFASSVEDCMATRSVRFIEEACVNWHLS